MKQPPFQPQPISLEDKVAYAAKFFNGLTTDERRSVGMSIEMSKRVKQTVKLIAQDSVSTRSYLSAIIRAHLAEFKPVHEYCRRLVYGQLEPGDTTVFEGSLANYVKTYMNPGDMIEAKAWMSIDRDLVKAMGSLVSWLNDVTTISSFVNSILEHHFAKYGDMLEEMKTDTYLAQP